VLIPSYTLANTLGQLFDTEISRKLNHPPALAVAIDIPNPSLGDVFPVQKAIEDPLVQVDTDVVRRLWRFG